MLAGTAMPVTGTFGCRGLRNTPGRCGVPRLQGPGGGTVSCGPVEQPAHGVAMQ